MLAGIFFLSNTYFLHMDDMIPNHPQTPFTISLHALYFKPVIVLKKKDGPYCRSTWAGSGQIIQTPQTFVRLTQSLHQVPHLQCVHIHCWSSLELTVLKSGCPMHAVATSNSSASLLEGSCPVKAPNASLTPSNQPPSSLSKLNPLNYMPSYISQSRAENQKKVLPVERTVSSIPRGDAESNWEYPSPQQMYNAMLRKGYDDTPEDAVESMVAVHNFLNEGAWNEIEGWEERFSRGLSYGWRICRRGEEEFVKRGLTTVDEARLPRPKLLRFQGRPNDITPKARILELIGKVYPAKYG